MLDYTRQHLFGAALDLGARQQDAPSAFFAAQADIGSQPDDLPVEAAAGMLFAEAQAIAQFKMKWLHSTSAFFTPSPSSTIQATVAIQIMVGNILHNVFWRLIFDGPARGNALTQVGRGYL